MARTQTRNRQRQPAWPLITLLTVGLLVGPAAAQLVHPGVGEWGDAPEGNLAYPALGVIGSFPTLFATAGAGYVWHGMNAAFFGANVDFELDGNGGFNGFPPYDRDECYGPYDGDAGVFGPIAATIDLGMNVVPCDTTALLPTTLGYTCTQLMPFVGSIFDIMVTNFSGTPCVINILFDWNQDGRWGGQSLCPNGAIADEHAVVNLFVPDPYSGPLSGLGLPQIQVGPNSGHVWARFSIMNIAQAPPIGWDGSGEFDVGETEDYLLRIDSGSEAEYGDAPEDILAYPNGVMGRFPTCISNPAAGYIQHAGVSTCWFGPGVDFEFDGNAGQCGFAQYDQDECGQTQGDAGLLFPESFTLDNGTLKRCDPGPGSVLWHPCSTAVWGQNVDIEVTNTTPDDRYVNVLVDWDVNGEWGGAQTCPNGVTTDEHILVNWPVPAGFSGPLSMLNPPSFEVGDPLGAGSNVVWTRFSITDAPVPSKWTGEGNFHEGETEDYLIRVGAVTGSDAASARTLIAGLGNYPNPFNPRTTLHFTLGGDSDVSVRILNPAGRVLRELFSGRLQAGEVALDFDGRDRDGRELPSGVYFADVHAGNARQTLKLLMLK
jgi:hypothetical protein